MQLFAITRRRGTEFGWSIKMVIYKNNVLKATNVGVMRYVCFQRLYGWYPPLAPLDPPPPPPAAA